jgi:hypothetical protein
MKSLSSLRMLDPEFFLMRSLWCSNSWLSCLTLTLRPMHLRNTGSFHLAHLAINYQSERSIFQVSMYSRQHTSRKHLMKGMHAFSLSGGINWSICELATLKKDNSLDQRPTIRSFIHYKVKGCKIALSSMYTTDHMCYEWTVSQSHVAYSR